MIYNVQPVAKPRMTRRDKWTERPPVMRYRAFKDHCLALGMQIPKQGAYIRFKIAMPKSWSKKKKEYHNGQPHEQKPDLDNLLKGLLDIYPDDSGFWHFSGIEKRWSYKGAIEIDLPPADGD